MDRSWSCRLWFWFWRWLRRCVESYGDDVVVRHVVRGCEDGSLCSRYFLRLRSLFRRRRWVRESHVTIEEPDELVLLLHPRLFLLCSNRDSDGASAALVLYVLAIYTRRRAGW